MASRRSLRIGRRALADSRRILPGVSSPERLVRSMRVTARSSHAACHSFLTVRLVRSVAARRSTALRLTLSSSTQSSSRAMPGFRGATGTSRGAAVEGDTVRCFGASDIRGSYRPSPLPIGQVVDRLRQGPVLGHQLRIAEEMDQYGAGYESTGMSPEGDAPLFARE